jgi:hypothetical protein
VMRIKTIFWYVNGELRIYDSKEYREYLTLKSKNSEPKTMAVVKGETGEFLVKVYEFDNVMYVKKTCLSDDRWEEEIVKKIVLD